MRYRIYLIALTVLACSLFVGCKPKVVYVEGQKTEWVEKGTPAPFSGYLVEKGKMLKLLKLADKAVTAEEKRARGDGE